MKEIRKTRRKRRNEKPSKIHSVRLFVTANGAAVRTERHNERRNQCALPIDMNMDMHIKILGSFFIHSVVFSLSIVLGIDNIESIRHSLFAYGFCAFDTKIEFSQSIFIVFFYASIFCCQRNEIMQCDLRSTRIFCIVELT